MAFASQFEWNTGHKVSALLHGGLILWVIFFDLFHAPSDPMIPEVTEVAIISAQDFADLTREPLPAPTPDPEPAAQITPPAPVEPVVQAPVTPPAPITPPQPVAPEPPQAAVVAPTVTPEASLTPVQRPAERVAPEAAPTPEPEVAIALQDQAAITPDADATVDAPEAQEATQREAAATETVTEATIISETEPARRTATAPEVSIRPRRRQPQPVAPEPQEIAQPAPEVAPEPAPTDVISSAIEDALAQALLEPEVEAPTLSGADMDMLRLNVQNCWNVGILSTEAQGVIVTIGFEMTPDARPIPSSIYQVSAEGGSIPAQLAAFDAGRQAIIECGSNGYGLPQDLYDLWRNVEIRFNPAQMSTR